MNAYNFEIPSRQSIKGIVVIFGVSAFQIVKGSWVFVLLFILKFLQSGKGPNLSNPWIAVSGSGILILILAIAILQFINFKFYLKDGYFFLKKGILNKEEISVSTSKIQRSMISGFLRYWNPVFVHYIIPTYFENYKRSWLHLGNILSFISQLFNFSEIQNVDIFFKK